MSIDYSVFISGVKEKYPEELLEHRITVEGNVIAAIWKDPLLLDENRLESSHFLTKDGKFYFGLAKKLRRAGLNVFDEVSVLSNISDELLAKWNDRGGYDAIDNMTSIISLQNWDTYADVLNRENILLKLFLNGFNLLQEVEYKDKKVIPIKLFRKMTSEQVVDWYDAFLSSYSTGYSSLILEEEMVDINDDFINSIEEGNEAGWSFRSIGTDIEGKDMTGYPFLSDELGGYRDSSFNLLCGHSSTGKSSMAVSIILSMLNQGHRVLLISNEQKASVFKTNFLVHLLYKRNHYYKLTKKKIMSGILTDEDKKQIASVQKYWRDQGYNKRLKFISIADANMPLVKKKIRESVLRDGTSFIFYDTMKLDMANNTDKQEYLRLIQDSRDFDAMAKKYNIVILASLQLALSSLGKLFLDASTLSQSKGIKECCETIIMMRVVYKEEIEEGNKFYCKPFRTVKSPTKQDEYITEEYKPDPDAVWRMVFVDKSRSSSNSSDTGIAYLYKMIGNYCVFVEASKCYPKHGIIQG